jgi:hypothetical protein
MELVTRYWITGLAVLLGLFYVFIAVAILVDEGDEQSWQEEAFGVGVMALTAIALFGGLWILRSRRLSPSVGLGLVTVGLLGGIIWFWMVIPLVVALLVLVFGIVRGGLQRELSTG